MNERIREIATKAILQCVDENGFLGKDKSIRINPGNIVDQTMVQDFIEVFCELILKEAVAKIEQERFAYPDGNSDTEYDSAQSYYDCGYVDGMYRAETLIRELFGVKL